MEPETGHPVHELPGPTLLLAGPGTGKTYCLAQRVKHLVEIAKVEPEKITVITFTGAAASEMKTRLSDPQTPDLFVPLDLQPSRICTMHKLGHQVILARAPGLGLVRPLNLVRDATRDILVGDAAQLAGFERDRGQETTHCRQIGDCHPRDDTKCHICSLYKKIMRACNAIDHDDQILLACEVLTTYPELRSEYRDKATHLLIDEYQDINAAQFKLIRILTADQEGGLFAVGDDDQSIYSWRGGSPDFVRNFEKNFGEDAKVEALLCSRRCHRNILEGALSVVRSHDPDRRDKGRFEYERPLGPKILLHDMPSDHKESVLVCDIIQKALPKREVLVLVPRREYATMIVERLQRARIDYVAPLQVPGAGLPIFERLGKWLADENDNLALRTCMEDILNSKILGVPSRRVRKPDKKEKREAIFLSVSMLWNPVLARQSSLWQSLESNQQQSEVLKALYEKFNGIKSIGSDDVAKFLEYTVSCFAPWKKTSRFIEEINAWVARMRLTSPFASSNIVRIMTLQGAKGLQADVVCVVGLEEGTIPAKGADRKAVAEASRLMYVSMTRAKSELHLFRCRKRPGAVSFQQVYAKGGPHKLDPSRFLTSIPGEFVERDYHPRRRS